MRLKASDKLASIGGGRVLDILIPLLKTIEAQEGTSESVLRASTEEKKEKGQKKKPGKKGRRDKGLSGYPRKFKDWFHRKWKRPGDPDSSPSEIREAYEDWKNWGN